MEEPSLQAEHGIRTAWDGRIAGKHTAASSSRDHPPLHLQKSYRRQALRFVRAPVTWRHLHWEARKCRPLWVDGNGRPRSGHGCCRARAFLSPHDRSPLSLLQSSSSLQNGQRRPKRFSGLPPFGPRENTARNYQQRFPRNQFTPQLDRSRSR